MAAITVKGVVYDTDGNVPITSVAVVVTVANSGGAVLGTGQSSLMNGAYSVTYQTTGLLTDHWIVVNYQRTGSTHVLSIGNLSGVVANTINPQVPT